MKLNISEICIHPLTKTKSDHNEKNMGIWYLEFSKVTKTHNWTFADAGKMLYDVMDVINGVQGTAGGYIPIDNGIRGTVKSIVLNDTEKGYEVIYNPK